jgi:hypothetical protein
MTLGGIARKLVILLPFVFGLALVVVNLASVRPPVSYHRDVASDYLAERALLDGANPYQTIADLTRRYFSAENEAAPYPDPHPPPLLVVFAPLALLDFATFFFVWQVVELTCLVVAIWLLLPRAGLSRSPLGMIVVFDVIMLWYPVIEEVGNGQLMLPLLLCLVLAWRDGMTGRPGWAGFWLGLSILVKPILWPLVLLFVLRRQLRPAFSSAAVVVTGYAVALVVLGYNVMTDYFFRVLPVVSSGFRLLSRNLSFWTVGWRVFHGTDPSVFGIVADNAIGAPPLIHAEWLAPVGSIVLPVLTVGLASLWSRRRPLDAAFGMMTCVSIVVSPTAWNQYLVLLLAPAAIVVAGLRSRGLPLRTTIAVVALFLPTAVPFQVLADMCRGLISGVERSGGPEIIAALLGMLTLLPDVTVVGLGILAAYWANDRRTEAPCASST